MDRKHENEVEEEAGLEEACEHMRTCEDCKDESRDIHAAGDVIVSWSSAIAFLAEQAETSKAEDRRPLLRAIGGLSYAISEVAERDIVNESFPPLTRAPQPVRRAS